MLATTSSIPVSTPPVSFSPQRPASPPKTPPRARRPSLSNIVMPNPISWLNRTSSSAGRESIQAQPASKPIRISEPKFNRSLEILSPHRSGTLGAGATVVRTPQEALSGSVMPDSSLNDVEFEKRRQSDLTDSSSTRELPSPPESPQLPSVPIAESRSSPSLPLRGSPTRPAAPRRPTRPPPPPPVASSSPTLRPVLKRGLSSADFSPPVPSLPSNIPSSPLQPTFEAILVSPVPSNAIDPSKIIVSLETSTTTHRTTLSTLTSRPSYLSSYLSSLFRHRHDSDADSIHSNMSGMSQSPSSTFHSIFHNHLTSSGFLPTSSSSMHIFLDRPSAPYAHILSYLRSPPSTPEVPATLPHAVQLISSSSSRLEALLALRDEARYLDLEELYKLCTDEIRTRQSLGLHTRGCSSSSGWSSHSMHTLREQAEADFGELADTTMCGSTSSIYANEPRAISPSVAHLRSRNKGHASLNSRPLADWV